LDASVITVVEKWESLEALSIHLATPHMLAYREKVKALVEDLSLKVLQQA
jgi:quinol monooxygenase YgiN